MTSPSLCPGTSTSTWTPAPSPLWMLSVIPPRPVHPQLPLHAGPGVALDPRPLACPGPPVGPHSTVTCPFVTPVLRYFLEYQWFVDFAVYSTAVYLFTEGYYCLADPQKETNIGVLWCLLTVIFSVYPSADFWGVIAANRRVQAAIGQEKEPTVLVFAPLKAS